MSEEHRARRQAAKMVPGHCRDLEESAVAVEKAIRLLAPDGTPDSIVKAFDSRTTYGVIRSWRDGRRYIPEWARELVETKIMPVANAMRTAPRGPGMRAGDKNLIRRYR